METICQSCGMPMHNDVERGLEENGTTNGEYCAHCYRGGQFVDACETVEQKIEKNVQVAIGMGVFEDDARKTAKELLPKLKRWKKD